MREMYPTKVRTTFYARLEITSGHKNFNFNNHNGYKSALFETNAFAKTNYYFVRVVVMSLL